MSRRSLTIDMDTSQIEDLAQRYGSGNIVRAIEITNTYTHKLQVEARKIIAEKENVDTGKLIQSIQPAVKVRGNAVTGQVNAGAKYARFIHEGAKHEGEDMVPHFVPFAVASSLLKWAKHNKVVYPKTVKGKKRWFMKGKNGKEYRVDIEKGGLIVKQEAVKFFEIPFEKLAPEYFEKIKEII